MNQQEDESKLFEIHNKLNDNKIYTYIDRINNKMILTHKKEEDEYMITCIESHYYINGYNKEYGLFYAEKFNTIEELVIFFNLMI